MTEKLEFHGYTLTCNAGCSFYQPVKDETKAIIMDKNNRILATFQFVQNGLNIDSSLTVRLTESTVHVVTT